MHQQFLQLLEQLTVSDNVPRSAAEKQYEAMKSEPSLLPFIPLSMITVFDDDSVPEYIKKLAAILMRRLVVEEEVSVYRCMDAETYVQASSASPLKLFKTKRRCITFICSFFYTGNKGFDLVCCHAYVRSRIPH